MRGLFLFFCYFLIGNHLKMFLKFPFPSTRSSDVTEKLGGKHDRCWDHRPILYHFIWFREAHKKVKRKEGGTG